MKLRIAFCVALGACVALAQTAEFHPCRVTVFPVQGVYCLKAMKDGYGEAVRPWLVVPALAPVDLPLWALPDPKRRVVHGNLGHPAQLTITDSGQPVRGFDFAGTPVGGYPAPKGVWHHRNRYFWTAGEYAFTATGEVKIVESLDFPQLRKRGWYKGDFHAHIVHGENFYRANLQQMNFICRAERYDWIWLSQAHANDEYPLDYGRLCEYLSDDRLFLRINNEFPKNVYGHYGCVGVPPLSPKDYGPVPVHPLYGDVVRVDKATGRKTYGMINNELVLWLLCRPDMVPVVDFFYFPEERAEKFWYRLLNKGYTLACSGTSDAAFDVGRSPGDSHATYAKLDKVDGDSIVRAFREEGRRQLHRPGVQGRAYDGLLLRRRRDHRNRRQDVGRQAAARPAGAHARGGRLRRPRKGFHPARSPQRRGVRGEELHRAGGRALLLYAHARGEGERLVCGNAQERRLEDPARGRLANLLPGSGFQAARGRAVSPSFPSEHQGTAPFSHPAGSGYGRLVRGAQAPPQGSERQALGARSPLVRGGAI